jgi:c-di-GMP-binding flagellar brake protein YcgR
MKTGQLQAADHGNSPDIERITECGRIIWILTQLMEKRELLTISIEGSQEKFSSAIIEVDVKAGQAHLDELMPRLGNKLMVDKCRFQVSGRLDGINVDFNMSLVDTGRHDGLVDYVVSIPKAVNYWQRRDSHRVRLPMNPSFRVTLVSRDNVVAEGSLRDISHGGAQVLLKSGTTVTSGKMLYECAVELPTGPEIYCTVDVRYSTPCGKHNDIRAGIRFLDLTPYQQRIIAQCVASVELEYIRKRAL